MNFKLLKTGKLLLVAALVIGMAACQNDTDEIADVEIKTAADFNSDVALSWSNLMLEIDRYAPGYRPPAASRMMGYTGLAAYEAIIEGMPDNKSIADNYPGLQVPRVEEGLEYHWPTVLNALYAYLYTNFYPHVTEYYKSRITSLEQSFENEFSDQVSEEVFERSRNHGRSVAAVFFAWSATDQVGHLGYTNPRPASYIPPSGPGKWTPTRPDYTPALFPYWGQVRPFAITPSDKLAKTPLAWSESVTSPFYGQALEVYTLTQPQDPERQWIAEFWSDDFFELTFEPAGRWVAVANQVIDQENTNLAETVYVYAKLGMALCDVAIINWNSKFHYNLERPVHYINRVIDPSWNTTLDNPLNGLTSMTPEFPAYPSGHAGFGAAAAGVLSDIFDESYAMTDRCHEYRVEFNGTPRAFNSFDEMAYENALSRVYLGVHFRMDADEGLRVGYLAARRVNDLDWTK
ncbi:MAG: vanadium-dependent haloperoxidase [Saprospiraceae bacterium]|nr:vanadium-dependent haloperoxidase [Saprospiraceae bacterium]